MKKTNKGFTLIELLIVITIIGILAVAFLPTILGAPAKGRDTQRVADIQKIQKILVAYDLENGTGYPLLSGDITDALVLGAATTKWAGAAWSTLKPEFGGTLPMDPSGVAYKYVETPGVYAYGIYTNVEIWDNANATCNSVSAGTIAKPLANSNPASWCYALVSK